MKRVYDADGRPLCMVCGETQSEHDGGAECAPRATPDYPWVSPSDISFVVKALELAGPLEEVKYNQARMVWMARELREWMETRCKTCEGRGTLTENHYGWAVEDLGDCYHCRGTGKEPAALGRLGSPA